jgi:TrmH family RNA methyltransferase
LFTNQIATGTTSEIIAFLKERKSILLCYFTKLYFIPHARLHYSNGISCRNRSHWIDEEWRCNHPKYHYSMQGEIDSMNVSVAAAILIFEAKRQRGF